MERGLIDADLGNGLIKKRIGRSGGAGKRDGYRVIVAHRRDAPWFFIDGYAKNAVDNISGRQLQGCKEIKAVLVSLSPLQLDCAVRSGFLKEVNCDA